MFVSIEKTETRDENEIKYQNETEDYFITNENFKDDNEDFEENKEQETYNGSDNTNEHITTNSLNPTSEADDNDNLKYASRCTSYCDGNEYKFVMLSARIAHDIHAGKKNTLQNAVEWDKPTAQAIISIGRDPSKPAKILDEILNTSGDASTSIVSVSDFDFFEQDDTNNNIQVDDTVASEIAALSALNNI